MKPLPSFALSSNVIFIFISVLDNDDDDHYDIENKCDDDDANKDSNNDRD